MNIVMEHNGYRYSIYYDGKISISINEGDLNNLSKEWLDGASHILSIADTIKLYFIVLRNMDKYIGYKPTIEGDFTNAFNSFFGGFRGLDKKEIEKRINEAETLLTQNEMTLTEDFIQQVKRHVSDLREEIFHQQRAEEERIAELERREELRREKEEKERQRKLKLQQEKERIKYEKRLQNADRYAGFVYLVRSEGGYYKIGRTKNPANRIKTFKVKLPFEIEYVAIIQTNDMYALEKELHKKYKPKKVNGEWFSLNDDDLNYIKSLSASV